MIPPWNAEGFLPGVRPGQPGHSRDRSPYAATLCDVLTQFATTPARLTIFHRLLSFREGLHRRGVVRGFQWLNGSYVEHVERLFGRPPRDIDVVTFYYLPDRHTQSTFANDAAPLFDSAALSGGRVDNYLILLGRPMDKYQASKVSYWYSMWSHRRAGTWKGFVQVNLDPNEDLDVANLLVRRG